MQNFLLTIAALCGIFGLFGLIFNKYCQKPEDFKTSTVFLQKRRNWYVAVMILFWFTLGFTFLGVKPVIADYVFELSLLLLVVGSGMFVSACKIRKLDRKIGKNLPISEIY